MKETFKKGAVVTGHLLSFGGLLSYLAFKYALDMPDELIACVFTMSCGAIIISSIKD